MLSPFERHFLIVVLKRLTKQRVPAPVLVGEIAQQRVASSSLPCWHRVVGRSLARPDERSEHREISRDYRWRRGIGQRVSHDAYPDRNTLSGIEHGPSQRPQD